MRARELLSFVSITLNTLTAGAIFTFPLFAPVLARSLRLTGSQTSVLASCAVLGQYISAPLWGSLADRFGPRWLSAIAAVLFGASYGMLSWRYSVSLEAYHSGDSQAGQWIWFSIYYLFAGCATSASYFAAIITSTKSLPARHAGLAIAVPCTIFGLSPLFLSSLAGYFTSPVASSASGASQELDPARWLAFLAVFLLLVNALGAVGLHVPSLAEEPVASEERRPLLPPPAPAPGPATVKEVSTASQPLSVLIRRPEFYLLGLIVLLATGPCEMVIASLGSVISSLVGAHTTSDAATMIKASRALALRTTHVQAISAANTVARLGAGALSDWLSYSSAAERRASRPPSPLPGSESSWHDRAAARFRRPPAVSRLAFVLGACILLTAAFTFTASSLASEAGLWVLSLATGVGYGTLFTLVPGVVRTVWPIENFGRNWGIISCFSAVGAFLFTPLFGFIFDRTAELQQSPEGACFGRECFELTFWLAAGSTTLAAIATAGSWWKWWRRV